MVRGHRGLVRRDRHRPDPGRLARVHRVVPPVSDARLRVHGDRGGSVSGFSGAAGYPIDVEIAPPLKQSRLTIFFRFFLFIPAYLVLAVLGYVAELVAIGAWFMGLFMGRVHGGLRDVLAYWLRYNAQALGYVCLLTQRYPSFSDE